MSENSNANSNGSNANGPPGAENPMAPPAPVPPRVKVKKVTEKWDRGNPRHMQALVAVTFSNFEQTEWTKQGSKHCQKTACRSAIASLIMQDANIVSLNAGTMMSAFGALRTRVDGGDYSQLEGVNDSRDAHHKQICDELLQKIRKFEKCQKKRQRASEARDSEKHVRGLLLREAAVAGHLPSQLIYDRAERSLQKRRRRARARLRQLEHTGTGAGAHGGYGNSSGYGSSSGGGGSGANAGGAGVAGSAISRDNAIALRMQHAMWAEESDSGGDSDTGYAGMPAEQPSARKQKRHRTAGRKRKAPGSGAGILSAERGAQANLDNSLAECYSGLPKVKQAKIASKERVELAKIAAQAKKEEADRAAAAERHKRELEARAETNKMFSALLKAVQNNNN